MKYLLFLFCVTSSVIAGSVVTLEERYRMLCDAKEVEDASAATKREAAINAVEEGKYVEVYKILLLAHNEEGRELRLLTFRGRVTDKRNVVLGEKEIIIQASTWAGGCFEILASLDDTPRETLRLGSAVLVSGSFVRGTFAGVYLKHANATLIRK